MPIRIAAIDVSHWHSIYDAAYLKHLVQMEDVEVVALHDDDAEIAAKRARAIGVGAVYADHLAMLDSEQPDFVVALGRHDRMARRAHDLLDRGIDFLMEKPMGRNAAEVRGIVDKATARGAFVAVPLPQRDAPFMRKAREMLVEGRFGRLSHIYIRMNRFSSARYPAWDSAWMLDPEASAGGCLRNLGTHGLDALRVLVDEPWAVTAAQISNGALGQAVEDYASVLLRSESGVLATLEVGNAYPRRTTEGATNLPSRDRLLDGADGEWKICGQHALLMAKDGMLRIVGTDDETSLPGEPDGNPAFGMLRKTLDAWRAGGPPPASARDCLRAVELIDAAYGLADPLRR
ncbi:hypothetical protein BKK81_20110 [Cupriavidus sp. USMAHM13]|uniref:Gfo/Idh/MocA family protein n=1 Tax=Cupriavidus sp. USMAHM13 TaxID=1389192 RepID=UPI0008A6694E|nr:Gfo/Idh/MocA family oxidoreductase [Cupriavidus sp. USMAHM13]AOZ01688.1 hypothetical protein BKK81_20110 [Cupriavidus sp. USMAHM13]